jgi:hypothetical protein
MFRNSKRTPAYALKSSKSAFTIGHLDAIYAEPSAFLSKVLIFNTDMAVFNRRTAAFVAVKFLLDCTRSRS